MAEVVVGAGEVDEAVEVVEAIRGESRCLCRRLTERDASACMRRHQASAQAPVQAPAYAPLHISSNPCRPCVCGWGS